TVNAGTLNLSNVAIATEPVNLAAGATLATSTGTSSLGGTLTLQGAATVDVASGAQLTLAGTVVGGAFNLDKNGTGTLVLSNAGNAYGGNTNVNAGTLRLNGGVAGGTIALANNTTLDIAGGSSVANAVTVAGPAATITNSSLGGTLAAPGTLALPDGSALTLSSTGAGTGLTIARDITDGAGNDATVNIASGLVTLSGSNSYGGATNVAVNTSLTVGAGATTGTLGAGSVTLNTGATLNINRSGSLDLAQAISGAGSLRQIGSGTTTLTGGNTYSNTVITDGVLQIGNGGTTGTLGSGTVSITNPGQLRINRSDLVTLAGVLSGNGRLEQAGSGTTVLTANNAAYSGTIAVTGGTLGLAGATAKAGSGTISLNGNTLDIADGATVDNPLTIASGARITNSSGTGTLGAGLPPPPFASLELPDSATLLLSSSGSSPDRGLTIARAIVDQGVGPFGTVSITAGKVTLSGNNTFSGGTSVASGLTLRVDGAGRIGNGSGTLQLAANSTLDITGGAIVSNPVISDGATVANSAGTGTLAGTLTLTADSRLSSTGAGLLLSGVISGAGFGIDKIGAGTVTLGAANTYTGATRVQAGTLATSAAERIDNASAVTVDAGATLRLGGNETIASLTGAAASAVDLGAHRLTAGGSGATTSFDGVISGTGGALTKTGNGVFTLGASNTYTGQTQVAAGTLALGAGGHIDDTSALAVDAAGTLTLAADETVASLTLAGTLAGTARLAATTGYALSGGSRVNASSSLGAGALTVSGTGAALLDGNAAVASIDINPGAALTLGSAGRLNGPTAPAVNLGNGATLTLGGNETLGSLAGAGSASAVVALGGATLTTGDNNTSTTYAGVITGAQAGSRLVKTGSGSLTLSGSNSYVDGTTVSGGTLIASGGTASLGIGGIAVGSNRLDINNGASLANAVAMGGGTVGNSAGAGTLSGPLTLASSSSLSSQGGTGLTVSGAITGSGNLSVQAGTVTLAGSNGYSGTTAVATTGTLQVQGGAAIPDASALTLNGNAALVLLSSETLGSLTGGAGSGVDLGALTLTTGGDGSTTAFAGVIAGAAGGSLVKAGAGRFTLTGTNSYTGGTTIADGTLVVSGGGKLGTGAVAIGANRLEINSGASLLNAATLGGGVIANASGVANFGGTLTLTSDASFESTGGGLNLNNAIGGTGGITVGAGTVTLAGNNSYNGATTVGAGMLRVQGGNAIPDSSAVTLVGATTLALLIDDEVVGSLAGGSAASVSLPNRVLTTGGNNDSTRFDGVISGAAGGLSKAGSGAFTLGGASTYSGATQVLAGSLVLAGGERLNNDSAVTVSSGATLALAGTETVAALNLLGTLGGSGTLIAPIYTFNGGSTLDGANLGAGTLNASGVGTLGGTADVGIVNVSGAGSRLTTDAASRFTGKPTTTVGAGATLVLGTAAPRGGSETLGWLAGSGAVVMPLAGSILSTGEVGDSTFNGVISGLGGLTKLGAVSSIFTLGGANSYSGPTLVQGGILATSGQDVLPDATALTLATNTVLRLGGTDTVRRFASSGTREGAELTALSYVLTGGTQGNMGTGDLTIAGDVLLAGTSQASVVNILSGTLTLDTGTGRLAAAPVTTIELGGNLVLGGNETLGSLAGGATGAGNVNLNSFTLSTGNAGSSSYSGVISGTGNLVKQGALTTFTLGGANLYTGTTTVQAGTLVTSAANVLPNNSAVTVDSLATLQLGGSDAVSSLVLAGTLNGSGHTLTASTYALNSGSVNANLGAGDLSTTATGSGTSTLTGSAAVTSVDVGSGSRLILAAANRLTAPSVAVTVAGTLQLNADQTMGSLAGAGNVELNTFRLSTGTGASSSYAGVASGAGGITKLGAATFTMAGVNTYTGSTRVEDGTLTLGGSLASTAIDVAGGTLALGAADRLLNAAAISVNGGAFLALGGTETVGSLALSGTLSGTGKLSAPTYTLAGGSTLADANLGTGTLTSSGSSSLAGTSDAGNVNVDSGNLSLASASRLTALPAVTVAAPATLTLGGDQSAGTLALAGILAGSGHTLSATRYDLDGASVIANLGTGALNSLGSSTLTGSAAATVVNVNGGTLSLAAANRLAPASVVTVATGANLSLGANQTIGSLAGTGAVDLASFTLGTGAAGDSNFGGVLGGTGNLVKQGALTTFTLAGSNTYTGLTTVQGGTLAATGSNVLADTSTLSVASGAAMTMVNDDTVAALTLSGTLSGTGMLSAATYALAGGTANANLGTGTLTSTQTSRLAGSSAAATVNVDDGTLTLASVDRLANAAAVTVASGAALALTGNDSIASLTLAGTLGGSGTLTAATYALNSGRADANLGSGALTSTGSSTLAGTAAAATVGISSGTLTLPSADRLSAATAVSVASGATLATSGNQTFGSLAGAGTVALAGATLASGSLASSEFSGVISGSGNLVKQGDGNTFTLSGTNSYTGSTTVAAGTLALSGTGTLASSVINVDAGTLALAAAERLANTAALSVASGATMTLAGDETVTSLALAGTLAGSGTLSAGTYALNGGSTGATANLGGGTLTSIGASRLAGTSAAGNVSVNGGALTLAAAGRLTATPAVNVASGASLALAGDQTLGSLAGAGTIELDSFLLRTGALGDSSFDGVIAGTGGIAKQGSSSFTLNGANTYTGNTRVEAGTLALSATGTLASGSVSVDAGTLALAAAERLANGAAV
ncbi:beta strand repeat-containing protein, partial [Rubrivivax sp. A210]|uniref:beta strand repeat-containing protein n=1 Tax=Rubrivivax sp. A210 TaxID=2772301 RepID=UPI001919BEB8